MKIAYFSLIFGDRFPLIKPKIKTYGANGQYETENFGNWYWGSLYIGTIGFRRSAHKKWIFHFEKHPIERLGPLRLWQCLHNPGSDTI